MDHFIEELINMGIGQFMDQSREELAQKDGIFQKDSKALAQLEERFAELNLTCEQRTIAEDYIACTQTLGSRMEDISYMAGIRDAVRMFCGLGLLNNMKAKEKD